MATIQERKSKDGKVTFRAQVRLKGFPPQTASFDRKNRPQQTDKVEKIGR